MLGKRYHTLMQRVVSRALTVQVFCVVAAHGNRFASSAGSVVGLSEGSCRTVPRAETR